MFRDLADTQSLFAAQAIYLPLFVRELLYGGVYHGEELAELYSIYRVVVFLKAVYHFVVDSLPANVVDGAVEAYLFDPGGRVGNIGQLVAGEPYFQERVLHEVVCYGDGAGDAGGHGLEAGGVQFNEVAEGGFVAGGDALEEHWLSVVQ